MQPPQPAQSNVGNSNDNDTIFQLPTTLTQGIQTQNKERENQDKRLDHLEKQIGQIAEFVGQFRDQGELLSSTIANPKGEFETTKEIMLRSDKEVGTDPQPSKSNHKEEEYTQPTARVETPLPEAPIAPTPSNSSKVVPNLISSNPIPPNIPIPCRFMNSKEEESEKDTLEALPKVKKVIDTSIKRKGRLLRNQRGVCLEIEGPLIQKLKRYRSANLKSRIFRRKLGDAFSAFQKMRSTLSKDLRQS
ncbi:S ribonuclease [Pyrus ussuriensis x Pyrus communis]|uniref:S ribonuclease n=1 Tax=Pyrus ussuriensis x Pyrus communis TaxID=2448454 RepID=A0A5N5I664_9ROSA|nr:S ribonuclease [Pyrus ussuriensis x Pyrus communis]KAB2631095.1 S ribonuclease [Pyrus ussuriensis x Pyrus communis]